MQIKEVIQFLEQQFPLSSQASFDNCGLLVGDALQEITSVLTCLDCTEEVIEEAMDLGCNLIVAHHPIIFSGLKKITGKNYVERVVIKAIQAGISIYAIHTNLDHSIRGVNAEIARRIGIKNPRILQPNRDVLVKLVVFVPESAISTVEKAIFSSGGGTIGNYEACAFESEGIGSFTPLEGANPTEGTIGFRTKQLEKRLEVLVSTHKIQSVTRAMIAAHPYEEVAYEIYPISNVNQEEGSGMIGELEQPVDALTFLAQLKHTFRCGCIRHTDLGSKPIHKVAFCGGSGSFLLKDAISQGAEIFITGDFKYHEFFDADNQIVIADVGHFESEQFTINLIAEVLTKNFTKFAVLKTRVNTNPINYF